VYGIPSTAKPTRLESIFMGISDKAGFGIATRPKIWFEVSPDDSREAYLEFTSPESASRMFGKLKGANPQWLRPLHPLLPVIARHVVRCILACRSYTGSNCRRNAPIWYRL
jgi:hypothetical protein